MRDGTEDVEHELAGGRRGVEAILEAHEMDATGLEVGNDLEEFLERAPEPGDAQAIPGSGLVDEFGESGAVGALSGGDVGEYAEDAGFEQAIALSAQALVGGRDAGVAEGVAHACRRPRLGIVRFQDGFRVHTLSAVQGFETVSLFVYLF